MTWVAAVVMLCSGGFEVLEANLEYRAVTLEPGQRKGFKVRSLETVTGTSGPCIEEGMDLEENETFWMRATCGGVRTAMVWKTGGHRVQVMACAEDAKARPAAALKLRLKVQAQAKLTKMQTACVHNGRVEFWGWAKSADEKAKLDALVAQYGEDLLQNFVEVLPAEGDDGH
jgi:hypothetical protein